MDSSLFHPRICFGCPRRCLTVSFKMSGMKNRLKDEGVDEVETVLAVFGEARLVKVGVRLHLDGGSMADRMDALDWASTSPGNQKVTPRPGCRLQSNHREEKE